MKWLLLIVSVALPSHAANYFVDYVGGADSANGTSSSTPFQHSPGDPRATSNANITLAAGDTVVFKGGVTYAFDGTTDYISANASGTSGNVITYLSGDRAAPQWGTTSAYIDGTSADMNYPTIQGILNLGGKNWITVDGLTIGNQTNRNDVYALIAWHISNVGGNIIIQNCTLTNSAGEGIIIQGTFGAGSNPTNFYFYNDTISIMNTHGIWFRAGMDNLTVGNCTISRSGTNAFPGTAAGDSIFFSKGAVDAQNNIQVTNCDFSYSASKGSLIFEQNMSNIVVDSCYFHGTNHVFSITTTGAITNVTVRNCVFNQPNTTFEGTIRFYTDEGTASGPVIDGFKIYNNTFISDLQLGSCLYFYKGNSTAATLFYNIDIRNNIIKSVNNQGLIFVSANSAASGPVVDLATFTCDYNDYFGGPANQFTWNGVAMNFATWKSTTSQDTHSITTAPVLDGNFAPGLGGNVVDAGTTLAGFNTDKIGITRPKGSAWDIGAFEFNGFATATINGATLSGFSKQ